MIEVKDDIWNYWNKGYYIVIPTNGFVKSSGVAVMGRGLAKQLSIKQPEFPSKLGKAITHTGNKVYVWNDRIITFPVKHNWWEKANLELIEKSCKELKDLDLPNVVMPRVGCGNGKLQWDTVKTIIEYYLDNKVTICDFV